MQPDRFTDRLDQHMSEHVTRGKLAPDCLFCDLDDTEREWLHASHQAARRRAALLATLAFAPAAAILAAVARRTRPRYSLDITVRTPRTIRQAGIGIR